MSEEVVPEGVLLSTVLASGLFIIMITDTNTEVKEDIVRCSADD